MERTRILLLWTVPNLRNNPSWDVFEIHFKTGCKPFICYISLYSEDVDLTSQRKADLPIYVIVPSRGIKAFWEEREGQHNGECQATFWQQSWPTVYSSPWPKSTYTQTSTITWAHSCCPCCTALHLSPQVLTTGFWLVHAPPGFLSICHIKSGMLGNGNNAEHEGWQHSCCCTSQKSSNQSASSCLFFLSLTGTPANFSPEECWYVLDMVNRWYLHLL